MRALIPLQSIAFVHGALHDEHGDLRVIDTDDRNANEQAMEFKAENLEIQSEELDERVEVRRSQKEESGVADSVEEADEEIELDDVKLVRVERDESNKKESAEFKRVTMSKEK
jgi:hypothetical protein